MALYWALFRAARDDQDVRQAEVQFDADGQPAAEAKAAELATRLGLASHECYSVYAVS